MTGKAGEFIVPTYKTTLGQVQLFYEYTIGQWFFKVVCVPLVVLVFPAGGTQRGPWNLIYVHKLLLRRSYGGT